jgi:hypothetical protein
MSKFPMIVTNGNRRYVSKPESHDGTRLRIPIFDAKDAKVVDSETTQIGERAIGPLIPDSALAPGFRGR